MKSHSISTRFILPSTLGFLLGAVCSGAIAYWFFIAPERSNQPAGVGSTTSLAESASETHGPQEPSTRVSNSFKLNRMSVRNVEELEGIQSPFEQDIALRIFLASQDELQVGELFTKSQEIFSDADRMDLQSAIVQRLAQLNPHLALTQVLEMSPQHGSTELVGIVFQEWAHSNLDAAVSRARTLDEHARESALGAIVRERMDLSEDTVREIARDLGNEQIAISAITQRKIQQSIGDPRRAWTELATQLQNDASHRWTIARVAIAWIDKSGLEVLDQVQQSLSNTETRQSVVRNVLLHVAQSDPSSAFNYALTIKNDPYHSIIQSIASSWARSNPRAALMAASEIEGVSVRKTAEEAVVTTWAHGEPRGVLHGVAALPKHLEETATREALTAIARESPQEAAQLVAAMESGPMKSSGAASVASMWSRQDHEAALDWIMNEPGIQELRNELLNSLIYRLVEVNPELAMTTALAQPIEESEDGMGMFGLKGMGMESNVIMTLAFSNLDKAVELFPQVREGPTRIYTSHILSGILVSEGEVDRAFAMVEQVPESDRQKCYFALATAWASTDPKEMFNSMNRLPSKEVKSRAAMVLVHTNRFKKSLTDEQVEEARGFLTKEDAATLEEQDAQALQAIFMGF